MRNNLKPAEENQHTSSVLQASPQNYLAVTYPHSCTLQKASVQKDVFVIAGTMHTDPVRTGAHPSNKSAVGRRKKGSPGPLPAITRRVRSPSLISEISRNHRPERASSKKEQKGNDR